MKILLVEDHEKLAENIQEALLREGMNCCWEKDGLSGLIKAQKESFDLIILDLMLPEMDGMTVLSKLKDSGSIIPTLILSARDSVEDKVKGLENGADDYLAKPFSFIELLARIKAIYRRRIVDFDAKLYLANIILNPIDRTVFKDDIKIDLTVKEFSLLEFLMKNPGKALTRTMINEHVWDIDFDTETNLVDVYIKRLREKLNISKDKNLIHSIRGVGYKIVAE